MTKEEIQAKLKELGVYFDGRWSGGRLLELLNQSESKQEEPIYSDETIKNIEQGILDEVARKKDGFDLLSEIVVRQDGETTTKSGIVLPPEVLSQQKKTKYVFFSKSSQDFSIVYKQWPSGKVDFVREYSRGMHGEGYKNLAEEFVRKNNAS